jgi:hypothetical protein
LKTTRKIHQLPKSFYTTAKVPSTKWELLDYDWYPTPSKEELDQFRRELRLKLLKQQIADLRWGRLAELFLFLKRVKTPVTTFVLGAIAAIALLLSAGCATSNRGSLVLKDGELYWCVDASKYEAGCYKGSGETASPESDYAPE